MPDNALSFSAADWIELSLGVLLLLTAFFWAPLTRRLFAFAQHTRTVMLLLFVLPILLRLLLLPHHPVPVPANYDEHSHLLVADTLLHGRLANPPHALPQFFETFFVLQHPTYSSIYPPGQGLMLAFGRLLSGTPWTGILTATGCFCAFCFWMLRGYVSPSWALLGGILAVIEFGPLNLWMNCYWGGILPAAAGCLVFGALPRMRDAFLRSLSPRRKDSFLLGIGFGLHLLTRPFESLFLAVACLLFFAPACVSLQRLAQLARSLVFAACTALTALALLLAQNKQATGRWTTLPEALSQYQYGVPTTLTIEAPATPHVPLTPQQALEYRSQLLMHGPARDSFSRFLLRLEYRVRDYRFFFLPPLYLAAIAFLFAIRRNAAYVLVAACLAIFALGTNLFPYLLVHYLAAVTCVFVLVSVVGLQQLAAIRIRENPVGVQISRVLILLCCTEFLLWYSLHFFERPGQPAELLRYESWDAINHPKSPTDRHYLVTQQLDRLPGQLLVFVHYGPRHVFQDEWVWDAADIDRARVVWARDLGASENQKLQNYYPGRQAFLLDPDIDPPALEPFVRTAP